jgi:hypothetical protein
MASYGSQRDEISLRLVNEGEAAHYSEPLKSALGPQNATDRGYYQFGLVKTYIPSKVIGLGGAETAKQIPSDQMMWSTPQNTGQPPSPLKAPVKKIVTWQTGFRAPPGYTRCDGSSVRSVDELNMIRRDYSSTDRPITPPPEESSEIIIEDEAPPAVKRPYIRKKYGGLFAAVRAFRHWKDNLFRDEHMEAIAEESVHAMDNCWQPQSTKVTLGNQIGEEVRMRLGPKSRDNGNQEAAQRLILRMIDDHKDVRRCDRESIMHTALNRVFVASSTELEHVRVRSSRAYQQRVQSLAQASRSSANTVIGRAWQQLTESSDGGTQSGSA